jgi:hypothetical protein
MQPVPSSKSDIVRRARWIRGAGWLILFLAAGAALLPWLEPRGGTRLIGAMLVIAGAAELFAGTLRHETRKLAMSAGVVTAVAGLFYSLDLGGRPVPIAGIVMGWLFLRSLILLLASLLEHGSVRRWTLISAATDLVLGLIIVLGVSISALVIALFGQGEPLVTSFAWVLGASFVATGLLLLQIAECAAEQDV